MKPHSMPGFNLLCAKAAAGLALGALALCLAGCGPQSSSDPDGAPILGETFVGVWNGYRVSWVDDHSFDTRSKGMYVFKASPNAQGDDFSTAQSPMGSVGGAQVFYVRDTHMSSRAPGFYAIKKGEKLIPMAGFSAPAGKNGVAGYGAIVVNEPGALSDDSTRGLERMSSRELLDLAAAASALARQRQAAEPAAPSGVKAALERQRQAQPPAAFSELKAVNGPGAR